MSGGVKTDIFERLAVFVAGRPRHGVKRYRPFFIVGSGRCGSTLLRAILDVHDQVHIPPENPLASLIRDYKRYSRLPWSIVLQIVLGHMEFQSPWAEYHPVSHEMFEELLISDPSERNLAAVLDALYRASARRYKPGATRWGDKTPGNTQVLSDLREIFPDLRVIHMLRDGRDVVESFLRRKTPPTLEAAARHWLRSVGDARHFGAAFPSQFLEVRYEDLVREPVVAIKGITKFLDLTFDDRMLRHDRVPRTADDLHQFRYYENARGPIDVRFIGAAKARLAAAELSRIEQILGTELAAAGYADD
ncbi:MAG TPA: sulfotransferase [Gemmatimonadales bacterium]|nr:sulfotransferase [Gemmatimonadales bacterium]